MLVDALASLVDALASLVDALASLVDDLIVCLSMTHTILVDDADDSYDSCRRSDSVLVEVVGFGLGQANIKLSQNHDH